MIDPLLFRGLERLLIILVAGLSLWIAYRIGHGREASSGAIKWDSFSIELKKVGPSIFFGAFGTSIVIYALLTPIEVTERTTRGPDGTVTTERETRFLTAQDEVRAQRVLGQISADVAELSSFIRAIEEGTLTQNQRLDLAAGLRALVSQREDLLTAAFGSDLASRFEDYLSRCSGTNEQATAVCSNLEAEIGAETLEAMQTFGVE